MDRPRRKFRKLGEISRREALIAATLDCVAEGGAEGATVRAIAARAGVTAGLIRHYFQTKEDLFSAAYTQLMAGMTRQSEPEEMAADLTAGHRLARFVAAAVSPPVADGRAVSLWAGFIHKMLKDQAMLQVHRQSYLGFRDRLEGLIAAALDEAGRQASEADLRRHAIAGNALIDGLWLEGSALPDAFDEGELVGIAVAGIEAMLGLDLGEGVPQDLPQIPAARLAEGERQAEAG